MFAQRPTEPLSPSPSTRGTQKSPKSDWIRTQAQSRPPKLPGHEHAQTIQGRPWGFHKRQEAVCQDHGEGSFLPEPGQTTGPHLNPLPGSQAPHPPDPGTGQEGAAPLGRRQPHQQAGSHPPNLIPPWPILLPGRSADQRKSGLLSAPRLGPHCLIPPLWPPSPDKDNISLGFQGFQEPAH